MRFGAIPNKQLKKEAGAGLFTHYSAERGSRLFHLVKIKLTRVNDFSCTPTITRRIARSSHFSLHHNKSQLIDRALLAVCQSSFCLYDVNDLLEKYFVPFIPKCRCRNKIFVPANMASAISRNPGDKRSWYEERNRVFLELPLMISVLVVYVITVSEYRNSQIALLECLIESFVSQIQHYDLCIMRVTLLS